MARMTATRAVVALLALGSAVALVATVTLPGTRAQEGSPTETPEPTPTATPEPVFAHKSYVPLLSADGELLVPEETAPSLAQCETEAQGLWFTYTPWSNPSSSPYAEQVRASLDAYTRLQVNHQVQMAPYSVDGDFLNWGDFRQYNAGVELQFDDNGIPMINVNGDGVYYYQPTTIAQYALTLYGRWRGGVGSLDAFTHVADHLITMQDSRGAYRLEFPFYYYRMDRSFAPGWVSSLTQAQAMSVFARAWLATGEERYLNAGNRALEFLVQPSNEGGVLTSLVGLHRSLENYAWFKTFPGVPTAFTLNGMMFTMLGLYDWWQIAPEATSGASAEAGRWFQCGLATLDLVLPLYDLGGFSAYDLGHVLFGQEPNAQTAYHASHIALLHALVSVTDDPRLAEVEQRWRDYVEKGLGP